MSLSMIDGADHYSTSHLLRKWSINTNSVWSVISGGRNGNCLASSLTLDSPLVKTLPDNYATLSVGFNLNNAWRRGMRTANQLDYSILCAFQDAGSVQVELARTAAGHLLVWRGEEAAELGISAPGLLRSDVDHHIQFVVTINDTTGAVTVYLDGVSVLALTNVDTKVTANAYANQLALWSTSNGDNATQTKKFDDIWIDDAGTAHGDKGVYTLFPSGAGTSAEFTPSAGSNYQCVDETTPNDDTDYVSSSTINAVDTHAMSNLDAKVDSAICVQVIPCAKKSDSGSRGVSPTILSGATEDSPSGQSVTTSYMYYWTIWETDPDTSAAWVIADLNAAECGYLIY